MTASSRVLEVGAGLGALTVALAQTGAEVVAVERDPRLIPALDEVVGSFPRVRIVAQDALTADWRSLLRPFFVDMRVRKPCVLARLRLFG